MNTQPFRFGGTRAHLLALATLVPIASLHAVDGTWNTNGAGGWSDTTKWTGGVVASGAAAVADFSTIDITGDHIVTIDQPFTVGTLKVGDITTLSNSYTFAGTSTLTLDNGGSAPVLNIVNRFPIISAPLASGNGISKIGSGFVTLTGNNSGLSGVLTLQDVTGTNGAGLALGSNTAIGNINTININGTATSGQYLSLTGGVTLGSGVTINLSSPGGNSAPAGGIRSEGANTVVNAINGPVNVTLSGARISNNAARRLDISGAITGGAVNVVFRNAANEGIHLTNTGNSWTGPTTHSGGTLWFEPGTIPANSNLQIAASDPGTIQTNGTFTRALGTGATEAQFILGATRAMGISARGGALTVNFGGAGAEVFFDSATAVAPSTIRSNTLVLNNSTSDSKLTLVNPINLNGAARTIQTDSNVAEISGGLRGGAFSYTKTGPGTLSLPTANTWLGDLVIASAADSVNGGIVRITHAESLGAPATAKNINAMGLNRGTSILELEGGIAIDANKSMRMWGKNLAMNGATGSGQNVSLRSRSGNNTWNGNILIASSGGSYGVESLADTFTFGSSPATTSVLRNDVAASTRPFFFYGPGNFVVNSKIADNGAANTGLFNSGVGTLSITRADNDFDVVPNLYAGTTEIVSLGLGGLPSSLGVATSFNLGGTLRYLGAGDTSDRALSMLPTGATLDSSGTGPLVLNSPTFTHSAGITTSVVAPFALGATSLVINDAAGIAVGQSITGTNIAANTTITSVNVTTRTIGLSTPTITAASANGVTVTVGNPNNPNRTLTLAGTNTGNNSLAAPLSNPTPGILSVVKNGAGKWTLNGTSQTYTGATTINDGFLGFDGAFPAGSALTVAPTATLGLGNLALAPNPNTGLVLDIDGNLAITGPVNVTLPDAAPSGSQIIMEYASATGGANLTSNYRGTSFVLGSSNAIANTTPGSGLALTWTAATDNVWNTRTTQNWKNAANVPQLFFFGDSVRFDDTTPLANTVALSGELRPAAMTVDNSAVDYTFDGALGFLSGPFPLTKSGSKTLFIGGANTYTGGLTINAGVVKPTTLQGLGGIGNDIIIASGAQLDVNGFLATRDYDVTLAGTGVDGSGAMVNAVAGITTTGVRSLILSGNATIGGIGRFDVRPLVAGTGIVDLAGFTLTKSGTNFIGLVDSTLTDGTININEGTLSFTRLTDSGVGAVNVNNGASMWFENYTTGNFSRDINLGSGGTLRLQGSNMTAASNVTITGSPVFDVEAARTLTINGVVSGFSSLIKSANTGTLTLTAANAYAGDTIINGGNLVIGSQTSPGTLGSGSVSVATGATLTINRSDIVEVANPISGAGGVTIGQTPAVGNFDSLVTLTGENSFAGPVTINSGGLKIFSADDLGAGAKTITITNGTNGRPHLLLDGSLANITLPTDWAFTTSSGNTTQPAIGSLAGDNVVGGPITLTSGGGSTAITVATGTLTLNGNIAANTSNRRLILGGTGGSGTVNGVISNGSNPVGLDKVESNTWTLTGANSYTGTTVVTAGTLLVNGNQNAASGAISVASGATLGGSGTLGGVLTAASGSTVAPGAGIGTLTSISPAAVAGTLAIELNSAEADRLTISGSLDITGATLSVTALGAATQPAYVIASYGTLTGTFGTITGIPAGYSVNYNYNSLGQIALVQGGGDAYGSFETLNGISGAGSNADSDNDGIPNGIEFVLGGDPSGPGSASNALLPTATVDPTYLNFVFRRTDDSASYNPFVEYGSALTGWTQAQNGVNGVIITPENDGFGTGVDRVTVKIPRALANPSNTKLFGRLRVNIP